MRLNRNSIHNQRMRSIRDRRYFYPIESSTLTMTKLQSAILLIFFEQKLII
jgi:hypothetical protein